MFRALLFFIKIAVLVGAAWFLIEKQPGRISLDWWGHRIETSIGVLFLAVFLLAVVVALLHRVWRGLRHAPGDLGRWRGRNRQRKGYRALTQGMVAVAAGDPDEAQRLARKADVLLNEPPLTLLLSAQAAQLGGDDQAAKRYFTAMLERDETRFLGLRGLITQALRDGDEATALEHVRAAYGLRPRTPWVLTTLTDLSERAGDYETAAKAVGEAVKLKALPAPDAARTRAVLALERALRSQRGADRSETIKLARQAHKLGPDLVPATVLYAELLSASGRRRDAARMLERAWAATPHPALVGAYRAARSSDDPMARLGDVARLVKGAPKHPESLLATAEAALDASLWGEARRHLGEAADQGLSERICRLMARLEDSEHGDRDKAREWLMKAAEARPDTAWVCGGCGAAAEAWSARCGACGEFDTLAWQAPPRVASTALVAAGPAGAAKPDGGAGSAAATEAGRKAAAPAAPAPPADRTARP